jgi:solute carrier family 38 (sodium-coupled neutral amino acid transporter), member 11
MFGTSRTRDRNAAADGEARQPLLNTSREDLVADERVVFSIRDDEDDPDDSFESPKDRPEHGVRFQESVQVIGPPLRSTIRSRETGAPISSYQASTPRDQCFTQNLSWTRMY